MYLKSTYLKEIELVRDKADPGSSQIKNLPEWNLDDLYSSENDKNLTIDLNWLDKECTKFENDFKNKLKNAREIDWKTEYLDAKISIKTVKNVKDAVNHILKYGTMHTDSIITNNSKNAKIFLHGVNSSIAMHNVSTQFADGGEFGFGGEVGISTNKLPPRGPVGLNQLVSYKYEVYGSGQIRK